LTLCEKIINLSSSERGLFEFEEVLMDIFNENSSEVFLLDNIEIVFSPEFKRNPLQLFRHISRNKTIVVSWPGNCKYKKLRYAEPGHSEFFEEKVTDLIIHNLNA
jgi:hypothetical protein